jgi:hypothetical protein
VSGTPSVTSPNHYTLLYSDSANPFESEVVARGTPPIPLSVQVTETLPSVLETETHTVSEPGTRTVTEAPVAELGTRTGSLRRVHHPKWEQRLPQQYVIDSVEDRNSLHIPLDLESVETAARMSVKALVDCGATGDFINSEYVISHNPPVWHLS